MAHLKRNKVPKNWQIGRKGNKYLVRPNSDLNQGIPLLVALRDILGIVQNRKEVKKAIHEKNILVNQRKARDEKNALTLFDVITIVPNKQSYRLTLTKYGKFDLEKIKESEAKTKVAKVTGKKILKGAKKQFNLSDGQNFLEDKDYSINDSVVVDLDKRKIKKKIELKEKANVIIFGGKHRGEKGIITKMKPERKMAKIKTGDQEVDVLIKQVMAIE